MPLTPRLIILHKQSTSGRVRFLRLGDSILAFAPLPALAALRDEDYTAKVQQHPAAVLRNAEEKLGLPENTLAAETEFNAWADTPAGDVPILLASCTSIDPPFAAAEAAGGQFIAITEARALPEVERLLLRRAYECVLG